MRRNEVRCVNDDVDGIVGGKLAIVSQQLEDVLPFSIKADICGGLLGSGKVGGPRSAHLLPLSGNACAGESIVADGGGEGNAAADIGGCIFACIDDRGTVNPRSQGILDMEKRCSRLFAFVGFSGSQSRTGNNQDRGIAFGPAGQIHHMLKK